MSASLGWATSGAPIPSIAPFLDRAWKTFGKNIRQLTINVPLGDWESLFPPVELSSRTADSRGFLPSLEELTIRFAPEMTITNAHHETYILSTLVSPFISQFNTHLRKLNFISSAIGDHSGLFKSFASESRYFAKLDTLVLNIAFYPPILSDPSGLMQFMQKHSKILQDVRLLPTESYRLPFGVYLHSAPDATMNHSWTTSPTSTLDSSSVIDQLKKIPYTTFSNWLTQQTIAYPEILHDLQTLVVAPSVPTLYEHPFTPGWNWQAEGGGGRVPQLELKDALSFPVKLVKRSRDTLVNLVLMDRELQYEEIRLVVEALSHRSRCLSASSVAGDQRNGGRGWLKVLRIRISTLSPEIFDLLSKELTELKELEIKFSGLALDGGGDAGDRGEGAQLRGDDHVQDGMVGGPPLREEISPNDFVFRMQLRRYPSWRLSHLRLTPAYLVTSVFEMSIMDQMKICIPSLTYHGQGDEKRKTRTRSYDDSSFDAQMELIADV
ncbi:hypothetical protein AX16_007213 [Volvariella volvacea WC 439]|nr:hypothetical protein AX16_007213 [Volvariella volvacea WC 439]